MILDPKKADLALYRALVEQGFPNDRAYMLAMSAKAYQSMISGGRA